MAIGNVIEREQYIFIYDENGSQCGAIPRPNGPGDGLKGYTSTTVNVRQGYYIFSYDQNGRQISSTPV